jgi:hypothetical protein
VTIWICRWRMNTLVTSQYQPRLSSITKISSMRISQSDWNIQIKLNYLDINSSKCSVFIAVLHFTVTVGSSPMRKTQDFKKRTLLFLSVLNVIKYKVTLHDRYFLVSASLSWYWKYHSSGIKGKMSNIPIIWITACISCSCQINVQLLQTSCWNLLDKICVNFDF